ncbi:MAG TPA: DUF2515 family protein [Kofleriaceae bacterium]|nr:DUF2515 family protein [Kofleriaceae bacterium]
MIPPSWLDELDVRNEDNVSRTAAYLELYTHLRAQDLDLPWVLMAHLVSRNAGYLMSDLARQVERMPLMKSAIENLFALLERANWLIFHDAWWHLGCHLLGRPLERPRVPEFMIEAWARRSSERELVLDLVHNEQHLIEHRAVHHPDLAEGARLLAMIEQSGREKPLVFPIPDAPSISVGGFADLSKRIDTGRRIYDQVLADRDRRDALWAWARAHPHTGSREVYGGKPGPTIRAAWPPARARSIWAGVHEPMEPDPAYP